MKRVNDSNLPSAQKRDGKFSIDELVLKAINQGIDRRPQTVAGVLARNPEWTADAIEKRMEELATQQLPDCSRKSFWTAEMDRMLIAGARGGIESARKATKKILAIAPDVRLEAIQQRQRTLMRRVPVWKSHRGHRYKWPNEIDQRLQEAYEKSGLRVAVTEVENLTRWPRAVIYRRCRKLGIPKERVHKQRRWSAVDWKYVLDRLNHVPIAVIAKALHRSVKSVRRKVETQGYSVRMEDDYTVSRLARELHARPQTIRQWIQEGKLKRGRNRHIKESVVRQFLKEHGNLFDPAVLEPEMRLLLLECRSKEDTFSAAEG